jgi:hypothetical protein
MHGSPILQNRVHTGLNEAKRINMLKLNSITRIPTIIHKDIHGGMAPTSDLWAFLSSFCSNN